MDMKFVNSSNLYRVGYDPSTKTLRIEFKSGWIYDYPNIPEYLYTALMSAPPHGEFHAQHIKHLLISEYVSL